MGLVDKIKEDWNKSSWIPRTKKNIFISSLSLLLGLGGALGLNDYIKGKKAEKHQAIYGTTKNPTFTIKTEKELFASTLEEELFSANPQYKTFLEVSKKLDKIQSNLQDYISKLPVAKSEHLEIKAKEAKKSASELVEDYFKGNIKESNFEELLGNLNSDLNYLSKLLPLEIDFSGLSNNSDLENLINKLQKNELESKKINNKEGKYGGFSSYSEKVFEELTGKKIPDVLVSEIGSIKDENTLAYHDFIESKIKVEDNGYETSLLAKIHELGHACYQGQETTYFLKKEDSNESVFLEEAAAYLFETAATQIIKNENPELGENMQMILSILREDKIKAYNQGSNEEHAKGWAFADSLLKYFNGDSKEAFNYLSNRNSLNEFNLDIINTFNSYRTKINYDGSDILGLKQELSNRKSKLIEKLQSLNQEYNPSNNN